MRVLAALVPLVAGCAIGDPALALAFRNDTDRALIVRPDPSGYGVVGESVSLPARSFGYVFNTIGYAPEAEPFDYEIVDPATCAVVAHEQVDFTLAPDPSHWRFIVILEEGMNVRVESTASRDPSSEHDLEETTTCSETAMTLYIDNNAAMVVVVSVNGTILRAIQPGFRGELLTFEPNEERVVSLATQGGTFLTSWTMPGPSKAFGFFPDPRCGQVNLWLDDPDLRIEPLTGLVAAECPR